MAEPDLIPRKAHRALLYVAKLNDVRVYPEPADVERLATSEGPREARFAPSGMRLAMTQFAAGLASVSGEMISEPETVVEYLQRMKWLEPCAGSNGVRVTELGRALLHALRDDELAAPVEREGAAAAVVLRPDDPFVYVELTRALAAAGAGLLADPYFKADTLEWLVNATGIVRLLVGSLRTEQQRNVEYLRLTLAAMANTSGVDRLEVRASSAATFHDRVLVNGNGAVQMLGTSVTGVSRHLTTIVELPGVAAPVVREHVEELWRDAAPVNPAEIRRKPD